MLVGIIAANNLKFSPYVFFYTKTLDEKNIKYEVISPERFKEIEDEYPFNHHIIKWDNRRNSFFNYINYAKEVKKIALQRYDYIIVLTTVNAVFCSSWLIKNYCNKYIVDIRDFTYENNPIFRMFEKRMLKKSKLNIISSEGFKEFLPKGKYYLCHNITDINRINNFDREEKRDNIVVGYIGTIAYQEQCMQFIKLVQKDERFSFDLYGKDITNSVSKYVNDLNCERIVAKGIFKADDKDEIYKKCDLVFNCYGNDSLLVRTAISNKYYDGALYKKPLLVSPNTIMAKLSGECAFALDLDKELNLNSLFEWYKNINWKKYDLFADKLLDDAYRDNKKTSDQICNSIISYKEN